MSYGFKLACLSLAVFFLVHAVAAIVVNRLAPAAIRIADRMRARCAARFLFAARLAPAAAGFFAVALSIPSYLRFEPRAEIEEQVGWLCLLAAALSVLLSGNSARRAVSAILKSRRWMREREHQGVALAGLIAPRIVVADSVLRALSPAELEVACGHEQAHARSRDNWKRLLMLMAPFSFFRGLTAIESGAKKFSEWAADDHAVAGDPERAVALASALVRVARLGSPATPTLVTSLTEGDLADRVERLLAGVPPAAPDRWTPLAVSLAAIAFAAALAFPSALIPVYDLLERFIR